MDACFPSIHWLNFQTQYIFAWLLYNDLISLSFSFAKHIVYSKLKRYLNTHDIQNMKMKKIYHHFLEWWTKWTAVGASDHTQFYYFYVHMALIERSGKWIQTWKSDCRSHSTMRIIFQFFANMRRHNHECMNQNALQ